ncbi:pyruvate kinase [Tenuibacillus multivorans]|uniref:Pyruvate kinase n=1 Tax=Tenuibacillus multivorans TaxID=237069 RepID=A0A1G9ZU46_9BACI|nr:pyruvate kinase [Tenuibacillus multivorans]GEL76852.1 pyruvate kinase [Tenuibacillus multivorans]SDN24750.1 pyruvate kinase [Tenuibacillus multivorans]
MNKTKIVCTIGPASESVETLKQLIDAGMNVARLNFSHGDHNEQRERIANIRQAAREMDKSIAILLDTKGPEIRTGLFEDGEAELVEGSTVRLTMDDVKGTSECFTITYKGLIDDVEVGRKILLDDGLIELEVTDIKQQVNEIVTKVLNSGTIKDRKGVNVPNVKVNLPGITDKDTDDINFGIEQDVDFIAASFVRRPSDVLDIRELLENNQAEHIKIIPKIENREGVDNINQIIKVSDGIMVARGDLGVEIPAEEVPFIQKTMINECNLAGKPVITATQMLDSMQRNPRPTRAEASDVANAIYDGTDAIMLSGETAAGDYPVEAVKTMFNIAVYTEKTLQNESLTEERLIESDFTITDAISHSAANLAEDLGVKSIITPTESGNTARMASKYRPQAPIVAVTSKEYVGRQLSLVWGVHAIQGERVNSTDEMLALAVDKGLETNLFQHGDRVVITAGVPVGESGTTNLIKVHVVGNVVAKGQGIGESGAAGKAFVTTDQKRLENEFQEGNIIVTSGTDRDMMPWINQASGIIAEEGGLTSHAAVVAINIGIPVIVGVKNAMDIIEDGEEITIDPSNGNIYQGRTSVI